MVVSEPVENVTVISMRPPFCPCRPGDRYIPYRGAVVRRKQLSDKFYDATAVWIRANFRHHRGFRVRGRRGMAVPAASSETPPPAAPREFSPGGFLISRAAIRVNEPPLRGRAPCLGAKRSRDLRV